MDDLSRLLVQQPQPGARFGQGTLRAWNPDTFEHVIEWRGLRITGATILAGVDALTWQPGDQVLLLGADQSGRRGWTDWMVLGRAITPGPGAGEQAIDWMRSSLVRLLVDDIVQELIGSPAGALLIRSLLGAAIRSDSVAKFESLADTGGSWVDLPSPGPVVSGVEVSSSGRALVIVGGMISPEVSAGTGGNNTVASGIMSVEVTGATRRGPDAFERMLIVHNQIAYTGGGFLGIFPLLNTSKVAVVEGLNPGTHTFRVKYMVVSSPVSPPGDPVTFGDRVLVVLPL